jgi:hypothetical protein
VFAEGKLMELTYISHLSKALGVLAMVGAALAQTTTPPTPTPTPVACPSGTSTATPPTLLTFSAERVLSPTQISSTLTPTFPSGLAAAITANTMEIHESFAFNAQNQVLTLNMFPLQTGSPVPTPATAMVPTTVFNIVAIKVDKIYTSCTPSASVMFVGTVSTNTPVSPFGNLTGAPVAVSIGLTSDNPPKVTNVAVLLAGTALEFSAAGAGNITFTSTPVTPPGSTGGPNIVVTATSPTAVRIADLDASATTSNNLPLKFQWTVVAGAAALSNSTQAKASVFIQGGAGTYTFRVTVTDSQGNVATKDVDVVFL